VSVWLTVVAAGACSYLLRVSMLVLASRGGIPPLVERASRVAVPAAFAALAATAIHHELSLDPAAIPPAAALVVGAAAARLTRRPHAALMTGMPVLWLLTAALPT
jgi:branched-subunit amino acid transport protein